jgi:hypothetical protein
MTVLMIVSSIKAQFGRYLLTLIVVAVLVLSWQPLFHMVRPDRQHAAQHSQLEQSCARMKVMALFSFIVGGMSTTGWPLFMMYSS